MTRNAPNTPTILVVLGMHRSGTSALAGSLSRLGFALGRAVVPAAEDNPLGYFENAEAVDINEELLLALGRGWDDLRPLPTGWRTSAPAEAARARIARWIEDDIAGAPRVVLKDPRLCLTFPLWREVFEAAQCTTRVILAHRAVSEVIASLVRRDGLSERHALLLTLRHAFQAEVVSRGLERVSCRYESLMEQPDAELSRILKRLDFEAPSDERLRDAVAMFDPAQRHHRGIPPLGNYPELRDLLMALDTAGRSTNDPCDEHHLDAFAARVDVLCDVEAAVLQPGADALKTSRLGARHLMTRVHALDAALAEANALAVERLQDCEALDERLRLVDAALADCTRQLDACRAEATGIDDALLRTREGLVRAEALAAERLEAMERLDDELLRTREGLVRAEALAAERLEAMGRLDDALLRTREGLVCAEALAAERLEAMGRLDDALLRTREGLARAEALALERLALSESLDRVLAETRNQLTEAEAVSEERLTRARAFEQALERANADLASMRSSWSWRLTSPLRHFTAMVRRLGR